jgi:uncharacterized circularly permuted ATP-grasp superfamily protein/uncharacterized alpha-E superfamily protein
MSRPWPLRDDPLPLLDAADASGWAREWPARMQGAWDELHAADGRWREPWQRFFAELPAATPADLNERAEALARQIHEDGVTYNVYSDPAGAPREWPLQLLPFIVEAADWRQIEAGAAQRAALLNRVLADVYGPRESLRDALLPAALVVGHPGYLHGLHGHVPAGGVWLHIAAFDLARGPDGGWVVVGQRTQSPSGLGYVLENRLGVSRQFPQAFRQLNIQHLASGYRLLLQTLQTLAARAAAGQPPRLALLTPGPYNETYFEHAYLARYLGLPLVEGSDLTVRGGAVYIKTVHGLEPVHGLLRRLDDDFCDPLELRPDSTLGVPGLLEAVREGRVVMANALGAGFLESPAVHGFLPGLCERWLGEPLALPSLPTWWCGEAAAWQAVQGMLPGKAVHPSYPPTLGRGLRRGLQPATLPPAGPALDAWGARIGADPEAYTIQAAMPYSRTPLWSGGRLQPQGVTLRVYAVADGQGGWQVLPGGLARTATGQPAVSMQHGGSSLDTWVVTEGPVDTFSMLPPPLRVEDLERQRQRPVSSRTAENLYWMGRYTERTEHQVRLARTLLGVLGEDDEPPSPEVAAALASLAQISGLVPLGVPPLEQAPRVFQRALTHELARPGAWSVAFNLQALERTASALRDRLAPEHWRLIRDMGEGFIRRLRPAGAGANPDVLQGPRVPDSTAALERLGLQLAAVTGAHTDRMTRDVGWRLLTIGRLSERLIQVCAVLRAFFERPAASHPDGFDALLALFDSTITYRARFQRRQELLPLLDLLVMDEANPRAVACVLRRLRTELRKLPGGPGPGAPRLDEAADAAAAQAAADRVQHLLARLPADGVGRGLAELCAADPGSGPAGAHPVVELANSLTRAATDLAHDIDRAYFSHAALSDRLLGA